MSRIKAIQKKVYQLLDCIEDSEQRAKAIAHLHGVALTAALLARKRGEDPELATIAGLMHDLHAYKSGSYDDHAALGAVYARSLLETWALTTPAENAAICDAIAHHDTKDALHAPFDEVLKDADVLDHTLTDPTKAAKAKEAERWERLCEELALA